MFFVVGHLFFPSTGGLFHGGCHAGGHLVGVHDHPPIDISCSATCSLGQAPVAAQESFLVGIHDGHEAHLRKVEAFSKQVHTHQNVKGPIAQFSQYFHPVQGFDVGVDVPRFDAQAVQIFGQLLRHALGQGRHQDALLLSNCFPNFHHEIVHLVVARTHIDGGVQQPCGANHLFHHHPFRLLQFMVCRGGADINGLAHNALEFFMGQGAVVHGGWQTKAVVHKRDLSRPVPAKHGPNLWDGDMAFVDHHQKVL